MHKHETSKNFTKYKISNYRLLFPNFSRDLNPNFLLATETTITNGPFWKVFKTKMATQTTEVFSGHLNNRLAIKFSDR